MATTPGNPDPNPAASAVGPVTLLTCANCGARNTIRPSPRGAPHCGTCGKPLAWVVNADQATFEVETRAAPTVLVDLWAPWCGPCRFVGPILEELAAESAGRLKVVKVNVDDNQQLAIRFEAMSIPTIVVMRDGKVVDRIVGALPKPDLAARLAPHLKS
jgi:thioredoxin 2